MRARDLLANLRRRGISLEVEGERISVDAPVGEMDERMRELLVKNKPALVKLLQSEQRNTGQTGRRGLVIRWAKERGWIAIRDPTTGEWHEVRFAQCLPSVREAADAELRRRRDVE